MPYHNENPWPLSPPKREGFGYYEPFPFPAIMTTPFPMRFVEPAATTRELLYAERIFNAFSRRFVNTEYGPDVAHLLVWNAQGVGTKAQWAILARIMTEAGLSYEAFAKNLGINPDPRCAPRKKGKA